jgi:tetratricopeptide (TPR) repeat protein
MGYYDEANACFSRVLEQYPQSKAAAIQTMLESIFGWQCTQAALAGLKPNKKNSAQSNPQALALEALCYLSSGDLAAARKP